MKREGRRVLARLLASSGHSQNLGEATVSKIVTLNGAGRTLSRSNIIYK